MPPMLQPDEQAPAQGAQQGIESPNLKAALAETVARRIREAKQAREGSGIEQIWIEDQDQYDGVDDLNRPGKSGDNPNDPRTHQKNARSKVYLNITKPKTDSAVARVQEMLVPNDDKPWEIGPTPIPELVDAAEGANGELLTLADGSQAPAELVAKAAMDKAQKASDKMADWIEDQFVEGSVYAEMRKVIRDAGRLGTGVLKGPFPVSRDSRRWRVSNGAAMLEIAQKISPTSKKIDPRDAFPDPACGESIHFGSYFVERDYATTRQLKDLAKLDDYDREAIVAALREGPQVRARDATRLGEKPGDTLNDSEVFELYYYYGDLDAETLIQMGVTTDEMTEDDLYLSSIPAIVTMLNDRPIKAVINPLESGVFPFDFFPWEPVDGQPWGRGVPRKMGVAQRMLVAASRALMENAGITAGPQIAITAGALVPLDGNYGITGRKLWSFTPTDLITDIKDAMHVWTIPSAQVELSAIIQFALQMADELTNLPMLLQGQQGSAPELLGGMQMLMQNANAPLRVIAKQFDDYLVSPHLTRYYDWGMQSAPAECKGDMKVKARGSTALLQREVAREFLVQAHSLAQRPGSRINPDKLDAELLRANGVSMSSIEYTDDEWKALQEAKQNQPPPSDPRIEAANIAAEVKREALAQDKAESQEDRMLKRYVADIEFQIQAMEFAGQKEIGLAELKAMLAAKAIDSRDKRELFSAERALKLDPTNPTNQGL